MGENHGVELFEKLYELYLKGVGCDLTMLSSDSKVFNTHSCVVLSSMPSTREVLLQPGMLQRLLGRQSRELRLRNVKARELALLVQFAYLRRCDLPEDAEQVLELLRGASRLGMRHLVDVCVICMINKIDMPFAVEIINNHDKHLVGVNAVARQFVLRFLTRSAFPEEWCTEMTADQLTSLLEDDRLHAPYEEEAWLAVVRWLESPSPSSPRALELPRLLGALRLAMIHPEFLDSQIRRHPLVSGSPAARAQLEECLTSAQRYLESRAASPDPPTPLPVSLRPRLPHATLVVMGGFRPGGPCATVEVYDHLADRWVLQGADGVQLPGDLKVVYHGTEVLDGDMFLVGGNSGQENISACWRLDLATLNWSRIPSMRQTRCFVATVVLNGLLYAIGGREGSRRFKSAEVFNPELGMWSAIKSMSTSRSDAGVATLNGKIYVVGGFNHHESVRTVECYNPTSDTWSPVAPLLKPRRGMHCVTYGGHIFTMGGFDGHERLRCSERYDPVSNSWRLLAEMRTARSNHGMALLDHRIFVFGGYVGTETTTEGEVYDILQDRWYPMSPLHEPKSGLSCVVVDTANFSERVLTSPRDSPELLRAPATPRPRYGERIHPDTRVLTLPQGSTGQQQEGGEEEQQVQQQQPVLVPAPEWLLHGILQGLQQQQQGGPMEELPWGDPLPLVVWVPQQEDSDLPSDEEDSWFSLDSGLEELEEFEDLEEELEPLDSGDPQPDVIFIGIPNPPTDSDSQE